MVNQGLLLDPLSICGVILMKPVSRMLNKDSKIVDGGVQELDAHGRYMKSVLAAAVSVNTSLCRSLGRLRL